MNAVNIFGIFGGACRFAPRTKGLPIRPTDKGLADSPHGQGTCRFIPRTSGSPILPANEEDIDIPEISKRKNDIPAIILFT